MEGLCSDLPPSTGKDGEVKLWDGDTFARIQTLSGHVGEVRAALVLWLCGEVVL